MNNFRTWDWQKYLKWLEDMVVYIETCDVHSCIYYEKGEGCTRNHIDLEYAAPFHKMVDENGNRKKSDEIEWKPHCLSYYRG